MDTWRWASEERCGAEGKGVKSDGGGGGGGGGWVCGVEDVVRYQSRGLDAEGNASNFVETEQVRGRDG